MAAELLSFSVRLDPWGVERNDCGYLNGKFMQFQMEQWCLALGFNWYHMFRQEQVMIVFGTLLQLAFYSQWAPRVPVINGLSYKILTRFNLIRSYINCHPHFLFRDSTLKILGIWRITEVIRQSSQSYFTTSLTTSGHADIWVCLKLGYTLKTMAFLLLKKHIYIYINSSFFEIS